jgi:hypothetical protein
MLTKTPKQQQIHRMKTEWIEACQKKAALYEELDRPTIRRNHDAQLDLVNQVKRVGVQCDSLYVALGAFRRSKAVSSEAILAS